MTSSGATDIEAAGGTDELIELVTWLVAGEGGAAAAAGVASGSR